MRCTTSQQSEWPSPKSLQTINAGEKWTLLYYWWQYILIQLLWRTVWRFLKKLKIELPYDPAILPLGMYLEKIMIQKDTCLGKEMAAHSSLLAWEIPWTEEPGATVHGLTKSWTQLKQLSWYPVAVSSPGPLH